MDNHSGDSQHRHPPRSYAALFEKTSSLAEWRAWLFGLFAACGIGVLIYARFPAWVEAASYLVILIPFAAALYQNYHDVNFLDRETKLASSQVDLLAGLNDVSAFLARAETSIFRSHIEALYNIFLAHPDIAQDNLIEILHSRLMARNKVVELLASILITLGLIGTIIGLVMMMEGLKRVMLQGTASGPELLKRLMGEGGPLAGLGVAFYTTLIGAVAGGVILRILTSVVDASIMRYTAHLAELTEVNVLPFMRRMATRLEKSDYYHNLDDGGPG